MITSEATNDESMNWENLLDNIPDDFNLDLLDYPVPDGFSSSLSIDDIEQHLLTEDSDSNNTSLSDEFFSNFLLESPHAPAALLGSDLFKGVSTSPDSVVIEPEEEEKDDSNGKISMQKTENDNVEERKNDDPVEKTRKRKIRNRDAAVRSRERKKMYVKDLELKSKYYEAECKRLGTLLQCCVSENQALRLSLHSGKAFDASMSKQESAVLLLESLLLGSLLGLLGIIYQAIFPSQFLLNYHEDERGESAAPRKERVEVRSIHNFMMGRECKASRSRMRQSFLFVVGVEKPSLSCFV